MAVVDHFSDFTLIFCIIIEMNEDLFNALDINLTIFRKLKVILTNYTKHMNQ